MPVSSRLYDLALRGLRGLTHLVPLGDGKLGRGVSGRSRDRGCFEDWARRERDPDRPLVWFHAPSVGEGLQARAVLNALRDEMPGLQVAYSYFSPSAEGLARTLEVDIAGYLPWDVRAEVGATLDALRPDAIVFTKTEVWPGLTAAASDRGIPVFLAAATLPEDAGRLRWPARAFLRRTFGVLDGVLAISSDDGERFRRLGVTADRIRVTGDPAMDSVLERIEATDPDSSHLRPFACPDGDPTPPGTVVAGSTWEPDEAVLVPALTALRGRLERSGVGLRLIIAPHEPTPQHLRPLESRLENSGWRTLRLSEVVEPEATAPAGPRDPEVDPAGGKRAQEADPADGHHPPGIEAADAIIVDSVGILAELYTVGDVAYVGGAFHRHGLHSVLEPAAAGLPVLFGPRHRNARAARELVEAGGGRSVSDIDAMIQALGLWLVDDGAPAARRRDGGSARRYIEVHQGASRATSRELAAVLRGPRDS